MRYSEPLGLPAMKNADLIAQFLHVKAQALRSRVLLDAAISFGTCIATLLFQFAFFPLVINTYQGVNADVIGVSVDSPFAQEAWAQKEKIGITLASDLNKETARAYGTLLPDLLGLGAVSARAAFVIDKNGVIQYSEQTPTPKDLPNFNAIQQTLGKLK